MMQYNKKKTAAVWAVLFFLAVLLWLGLTFFTNQRIKVIDVSACDRVSADTMKWKIDSVKCEYNYMTVTGYAYQPGYSLNTADTAVVIYDAVHDVYYELPTENVKKAKLTEKAEDGCNYDYAQFQSVAFLNKIPDGSRIYILYSGNDSNILIETDEVIYF